MNEQMSGMRSRWLTRSLSRCAIALALTACASVAGPQSATTGAGEQGSGGEADTFQPFPCATDTPLSEESDAAELKLRGTLPSLAIEVDYVRFTRQGPPRHFLTFGERGQACRTASDAGACQRAIDEVDAEVARDRDACTGDACPMIVYAVTTRGDDVQAHRGLVGLKLLLGAIDAPADAWLLLMSHDSRSAYSCNQASGSGHRTVPGGFELRTSLVTSACRPFERTEMIHKVDASGGITELRRSVVEREPEVCVRP